MTSHLLCPLPAPGRAQDPGQEPPHGREGGREGRAKEGRQGAKREPVATRNRSKAEDPALLTHPETIGQTFEFTMRNCKKRRLEGRGTGNLLSCKLTSQQVEDDQLIYF